MIVKKEGTLTKQVDEFAWSSLHFAAYFGSAKLVKQLLVADREMAYKIIREYNMTPLHLAAINDNHEVVEEILNQCPDTLEAVTSHGQNLLHLACTNKENSRENSKMRDFLGRQHLLQNLIDQKDADGNTPFHAKGKIVLYHPRLEEIDLDRIRHTSLREEMLRECMEVWKERANTHLIVATLIATVSFAAGFTIPGGYNGDDGPNKGMAILWKKAAFQVFAVADTFAMTSSTSAMFLHYLATYERETKRLNRYVTAGILVLIAMVAMMVAFMTGLYVVLPSSSCVAVSICFICSLTLIGLIFSFGKTLSDSFSEFSKYYC
ncbi:protein ACCELERATED CELL DEATH 6-like [Nicotiana tabacum]|uniref:Protein ACCELERATED CELL DEATH 6-like n=1 Tax=Nicotiana tabacum TaxID=4097 RepID=A0AC58T5X8_TOBAC